MFEGRSVKVAATAEDRLSFLFGPISWAIQPKTQRYSNVIFCKYYYVGVAIETAGPQVLKLASMHR
jgi:hypothetical protein